MTLFIQINLKKKIQKTSKCCFEYVDQQFKQKKNFQKIFFEDYFFNMKSKKFVNTSNELSQSTQIFNFLKV